ncbi:CAP domain-containing protein [Haladaptatus sp. DJG-WS-42]|uniref:CAP domain-containing protein n=1 Tax=Haladaptatus sp. DJG-WS-42 TaxID=3120516 RepID=UPI0030CFB652
MVNKAVIIILAVVVFTSLAVGGLLGMQLAKNQGDDVDIGGDNTQTQTGDTEQTQQATETPAETQTTAVPETDPDSFNETKVAVLVYEGINAERADQSSSELRFEDELTEMALYHSTDMATDGYYAHESPSGETVEDRYRKYELYERCKILDDSKGYYHRGAESIGKTTAGSYYTVNGEQRINPDEQAVATAIVNRWMNTTTDAEYIGLDNARSVGVGVRITADGTVYATAAYC